MNGEEIISLLGLEPTDEELERERRRLHNKASDYLDLLELEGFDRTNRVLQLVIVRLIEQTEEYATQINEIREHLDKTPI